MDLGISKKNALILSSTKGLGFGAAKVLNEEGVNVIINGRNKQRGIEALSKLGSNARFIQADIKKLEDRKRLYEESKSYFGNISILVTHVDGPDWGPFMSKGLDDWKEAIELLLNSAINMIQKCIPDMISDGFGRIINISSTSAKEILPGLVLANSIKPALIGALGTLARETSGTGITVNNILPGPFDTDKLRKYAQFVYKEKAKTIDEAMELLTQNSPMKRIGHIDEFGSLCAFLCSKQASYITGQSIVIDGGQITSLL